MKTEGMRSDLSTLWRLTQLMLADRLRLKGALLSAGICDAASIFCGVAAPLLLKRAVDQLSSGGPLTGAILLDVMLLVCANAAPALVSELRLAPAIHVVERLAREISRTALAAHLDVVAEGKIEGTMLTSTIERLPFSLQVVFIGVLGRLAPLAAQAVVSLIALLMIAPSYAPPFACALIIYAILSDRGALRFRRAADAAHAASVRVTSVTGDVIRNAQRVVFNGARDFELAYLERLQAERLFAAEHLARTMRPVTALQFAALTATLGPTLCFSAFDVSRGRLSLGAFILLQAFAFQLSAPLTGIGAMMRQSALALSNLRDALQLGDRDLTPSPVASMSVTHEAGVSVEGLSFAYENRPMLEGISFTLRAGSFVCIVGRNGSGKSTLARVLGGFLAPSAGSVHIEGAPLYGLAPDARVQFALYVPQTIGLLNRSLENNGLYPPSRLTFPELKAGLEALGFDDATESLNPSAGVGEAGGRLSGGQVQKLELTRLAGVSVPLLILDETTSALDREARKIALDRLRAAQPRTTLVLITHDPELAALAEEVLHLEGGRLAGKGPHEQLMLTSGRYRDLWSTIDGLLPKEAGRG
jgi:ABC-type multidrug transport system fused ATPase/permease subunit